MYSLQEKAVETTNQNGETIRRGKPHRPKPEEQGDMPQHRHCPPGKHRGDRNPKYHEEQQKDIARNLATLPAKTVES
jgi:hypothetical protein